MRVDTFWRFHTIPHRTAHLTGRRDPEELSSGNGDRDLHLDTRLAPARRVSFCPQGLFDEVGQVPQRQGHAFLMIGFAETLRDIVRRQRNLGPVLDGFEQGRERHCSL